MRNAIIKGHHDIVRKHEARKWYIELITSCLDLDPSKRPKFTDIVARLESNYHVKDNTKRDKWFKRLEAAATFSKTVRIVLVGTTGVGKSATINSIFGRRVLKEENTSKVHHS